MAKPLDLRRQPFGKWLVLYQGHQTPHGQFWVCQCACNPAATVELLEAALVDDWTRSCGCDYVNSRGAHRPITNLTGQQRGQYLFVQMASYRPQGHRMWLGRCVCGTEKLVLGSEVLHGRRQRCPTCERIRRSKIAVHRWYGEWFVLRRAERRGTHRLFLCECGRCGREQRVQGDDLLSGKSTQCTYCAHGHYGVLKPQRDAILALDNQGKSVNAMARILGVSEPAMRAFLHCHPEVRALAASLPSDEILLGEAPSHV